MNININHSYRAFDQEINNAANWLRGKVFAACGYSSEVLQDRLLQRIIDIGITPYSMAVIALQKSGLCGFPAPGEKIDLGQAILEIGTGKITVPIKQWLLSQFEFCLHWAYCLFAIFWGLHAGKATLPVVLLYGVSDENIFKDEKDEQFVNYCHCGPIAPLKSGGRIICQSYSPRLASSPSDISYARNPLIGLLRDATLGVSGRVQLIFRHLALFFSYFSAVCRRPQLALIAKDFAYSSISFEMDRRKYMSAIVLTTSSYPSQPLWLRALRHCKVHLVWYAQNFKPIAYSADNLTSNVPSARWMRIDTHWVWTKTFADYIRGLRHDTATETVGPILWYLPELNSPSKSAAHITIFDTSPYSDQVAVESGGEITNYNSANNLFSFIRDVISLKPQLESAFRLPVTFHLKTKRGYIDIYDQAYFEYLDKLDSENIITLEPPSENMYALVSNSHLVIVYPFSSPAYIADFLKVPSIYYDPTNSIVRHDFGDAPSLINFANTPETLFEAAASAISLAFPRAALTH